MTRNQFKCWPDQQGGKMSIHEADIAAINELYDQYCLGGNTGDLELFISVWADDVIRMEPDIPPILGKEQVRARFEPLFEQFDQNIIIHGETEVQVSGDLAFSRGTYTVSMAPKGKGATTSFDGKWMDILKKQADGSWKIYRDCLIIDAPPQEGDKKAI